MSLDLSPAIRTALLDEPTIAGLLSEFANSGEASIFTRVPVPADAVYPYIVIFPDVFINDLDGLTSDRPVVVRDVAVYGVQPTDYRTVEQLGYSIRELFHRERFSIINADFDIVEIIATGPISAPGADEETIGRLVTLTIQTRKKP